MKKLLPQTKGTVGVFEGNIPINRKTVSTDAVDILTANNAMVKARLAIEFGNYWLENPDLPVSQITVPGRPARPIRPKLIAANKMPKRRINSGLRGRIALLHALAHIELNAIDLACDIIARFCGFSDLPKDFTRDWIRIAADEARHFTLLNSQLSNLGSTYGALPAHDGLWEAAADTAHDLLARLAIVPLVLEARGLDVTPTMAKKLTL